LIDVVAPKQLLGFPGDGIAMQSMGACGGELQTGVLEDMRGKDLGHGRARDVAGANEQDMHGLHLIGDGGGWETPLLIQWRRGRD